MNVNNVNRTTLPIPSSSSLGNLRTDVKPSSPQSQFLNRVHSCPQPMSSTCPSTPANFSDTKERPFGTSGLLGDEKMPSVSSLTSNEGSDAKSVDSYLQSAKIFYPDFYRAVTLGNGELIDLTSTECGISGESLAHQLLIENPSPFLAFARTSSHQKNNGQSTEFKHFYDVSHLTNWYTSDQKKEPFTGQPIDKVEYFLIFKGDTEAQYLGSYEAKKGSPLGFEADALIAGVTSNDLMVQATGLYELAYVFKSGANSNEESLNPSESGDTEATPITIQADEMKYHAISHYVDDIVISGNPGFANADPTVVQGFKRLAKFNASIALQEFQVRESKVDALKFEGMSGDAKAILTPDMLRNISVLNVLGELEREDSMDSRDSSQGIPER